MNARTFLDNFGHIANAPEGVQRLREAIIRYGVTGRLVESGAKGEKASELVERVIRRKQELIVQKVVKKEKAIEPLGESEFDFAVPDHWAKVKLGMILNVIRGASPRPKGDPRYFSNERTDFHWIKISDIRKHSDGWFLRDTDEFLTEEGSQKSVVLERGTFILTNSATIGVPAVVDMEGGCIHDGYLAFPYLDESILLKRYLFYFFLDFNRELKSRAYGMAQLNINTGIVKNAPFALPPLEEQKRIVAKVDELMALCDKLEALQEKREKIGELARTATLGALSGARPRELQVAWTRVQDNIQLLFGGEKALQDFQDTMVQLAIRGLLSPEYERPVETEKIRNSAAKLRSEYQSKNISRKQKSVPLAQVSEWQYPKHWAVESLDNIAVVIGGVTKGRNLKDRNIESFPYLRVANVQRGFFDLSEMKEISIPIEEFEKYKILEEDLLITEGGDWDKVGRTAIWKSQIPNCIHQNHVFKVRIPSDQLLNEWVALVLNSEVGKQYFASASKQTTNLASINMTQLRSFLLPIPHIIEQKAILQKVNSLVMLYQKATAQSIQEANLASDLAAAIVGRVTGTQFKEQEKMKAPKMELVSKLKVGTSPKQKDQAPLTSLLTKNKGELSAKMLWTHSGLEIAEFYQQLKTEMTNGWIVEPEKAVMREVTAN